MAAAVTAGLSAAGLSGVTGAGLATTAAAFSAATAPGLRTGGGVAFTWIGLSSSNVA